MTAIAFRRFATVAILIVLLLSDVAFAQTPSAKRPRLVLIIVADQFRYDYLTRFAPLLGQGGFKRLMSDGAVWTNANFDYVPTKTAPGHTAIGTGAPPGVTGIVANEWIDRKTSTKVTSVIDRTARLLGGGPTESANSPRRLRASTVGDELRLATGDRARVIGISDKPRAAILPVGRRANAAYWLSSESGNVVTSNYYFEQLPDWVVAFNRTRPLDKFFGARWERLLPESEYLKLAGPDSPPWENIDKAPGFTNAFPHVITGGAARPGVAFYDALDHSPFVNDVLVSLAEHAIVNEQLGHDEIPDLLSVSLSGSDHVGHRFGPESQEIMDVTLRLDGQIARLLDFVDARIGLNNTLVVLSSDHGVAPLWDHSTSQKVGWRIGTRKVRDAIRAAINARYFRRVESGEGEVAGRVGVRSQRQTDYIMRYPEFGVMKDAILNGNVYFNHAALKRDDINLDEITKLAGEAVLKVPGIARYFTRSELEKCARERIASRAKPQTCLTDPIGSRVLRGFDPERSGDLIIVQKEYHYLGDSLDPANHGSPYSYDTHVPLIIRGPGVKAGEYGQPASPADIAPTISSILGIKTPNKSQARILREALK